MWCAIIVNLALQSTHSKFNFKTDESDFLLKIIFNINLIEQKAISPIKLNIFLDKINIFEILS